jgi:hypothetical protein
VTFDAIVVSERTDTIDGARDSKGRPAGPRRPWRAAALVAGLFIVGILARSIAVDGSDSFLVRWLPWLQRTDVTMYYADPMRPGLVPVSRGLDRDATIDDFVAEYLAGPAETAGLASPLPAGTGVAALALDGSNLRVDLTGAAAGLDALGAIALRETLLSWEAVETVVVTVDGVEVVAPAGHLLFFYDEGRDMLVAEPIVADAPRDVLAAFLAGPTMDGLVGLPADVSMISFQYEPSRELLRLDFTYTESVRIFALDHPLATRRVLEGLIATMTIAFPQFEGLYLDFEGHSALGLGQCADLLRNLQVTPESLNDERLLARSAP